MHIPMTNAAQSNSVTNLIPQLRILFVRLYMMGVQFNVSCSAMLANDLVTADHSIYPLVMQCPAVARKFLCHGSVIMQNWPSKMKASQWARSNRSRPPSPHDCPPPGGSEMPLLVRP